jgi:3-oxoacyl-[acyl-carrier-protein] synthase II
MGDVIESQAIHHIYGSKVPVTALKSYMGHTMGACGVMETIFLLYMIAEGFVAPTLNLDAVDPRCDMINHVRQIEEWPIHLAAIQNFAFGGVNTALILRKPGK